ncbi:hypothetical protein FRC03_012955 [Tulasnella sp. 419]|nr:hypothetical protein FRC03_012955 [Tulasnella sp. 419]
MSSKSQLDLLVKVRYTNPLPPPPFPPKLLNIPTDPKRYAKTEFTQQLSNDTPLPMVVDAELGMPLDLSHWDELWNGSTGDSALNPSYKDAPPTDPRDLFMLEGFVGTSAGGSNSGINVSWLRKTEYISRDPGIRHGGPQEIKAPIDVPIDVSRASQLRSIEDSFPSSTEENIDLSTLRHPTKKDVTAVETFEVLPDSDLWANSYDIFRFAERPGERSLDRPDPRLDCAIFRPMMAEGDHFLAYYLTKDDEDTEAYKQMRTEDLDSADKNIDFHWIRDYETAKVEQEVPNEFLLVLDNGPDDDADDVFGGPIRKTTHDVKGAYYSTIGRKIMLKKKRQNKYDATYENKWDVIQLSLAPFSAEEQEERDETLAEVVDPQWSFRVAEEADAEGEVDAEEIGAGRTNGVNGHDHAYNQGLEDAEGEGEDEDAVMGD